MVTDRPLAPSPTCTVTHRQLPPFRKRRGAFVANLLSLFFGNEEETTLLKEEVGGIESYGGRLIPILSLLHDGAPCDLVLEKEPAPALLHYYRDDLGLCLPQLHTLSHDGYLEIGRCLEANRPLESLGAIPDRLKERRLQSLDGYVTDPVLERLAAHCHTRTLSTPEGSHRGNNKWLLHQHLEQRGLPLFDTLIVEGPDQVPERLRQLRDQGYEYAVIKSQVGASGIGIQQFPTNTRSPKVPELFFFEGPCMLQGWLKSGHAGITRIHSPSVQLFLDDERGVFLYDITEQILSQESVHEGNVSPPTELPGGEATESLLYQQATIAAEWLFQQGYRGTASVDFLVTESEESDSPTAYVCEVNARVTGATYPALLARHFSPGGAWLMRNLRFNAPQEAAHLLNLLDRRRHLYRPGRESGILPINVNTDDNGRTEKGQFLCLAPSVKQCEALLLAGEQELPIDWSYVRD